MSASDKWSPSDWLHWWNMKLIWRFHSKVAWNQQQSLKVHLPLLIFLTYRLIIRISIKFTKLKNENLLLEQTSIYLLWNSRVWNVEHQLLLINHLANSLWWCIFSISLFAATVIVCVSKLSAIAFINFIKCLWMTTNSRETLGQCVQGTHTDWEKDNDRIFVIYLRTSTQSLWSNVFVLCLSKRLQKSIYRHHFPRKNNQMLYQKW